MHRRKFLRQSCIACLEGVVSFSLTACAGSHYVQGFLETNGVTVSRSDFEIEKKKTTRQFIIVQNENLEFPIYLFRFSDLEYSALWMQCSHQGNELQALGDQLHCPAHGSEFDNKGKVTQGPASHNLRTFPVQVSDEKIFIDLRAR